MEEAIFAGDEGLVQKLLQEEPSRAREKSPQGNFPLHLAASSQQLNICRALLANKADPTTVDEQGDNALHKLITASEVAATPSERSGTLRALVAAGASINTFNRDGKTCLHIAASRGSTTTILILSNQPDFEVNVTDKKGSTPLMLAARNNRKDAVRALLRLGADGSALQTDAIGGKLPAEVVEILIQSGTAPRLAQAQIGAIEEAWETSKMSAIYQGMRAGTTEAIKQCKKDRSLFKKRGPDNQTVLHLAARYGTEEVVQYLLEKNKTIINALDDQRVTALHIAAKLGHLKVFDCLVRHGAHLGLYDSFKATALHYLACVVSDDPISYHKAFKSSLDHGASLDATDKDGDTVLHLAAKNGAEQAIVYLRPLGADIDASNKDGYTPIQLAARFNHPEVVSILLGMGAELEPLQQDYRLYAIPAAVRTRLEAKFNSLGGSGSYIDVGDSVSQAGGSAIRSGRSSRAARASVNIGGDQHKALLIDQIIMSISQGSDVSRALRKDYKDFIDRPGSMGLAPLQVAAAEGNVEATKILLDKLECDANILDKKGRTPLLLACKYGRLDVVHTLLARPQTRVCPSRDCRRTALHYLAKFPIHNVTRVASVIHKLICRGLDVNERTSDAKGFLAVHYAAVHGNANTIALLAFFLSSVDAPSGPGPTPLHLAVQLGDAEKVAALCRLGADPSKLPDTITVSPAMQKVLEVDWGDSDANLIPLKDIEQVPDLTLDMYKPQDHPIHSLIGDRTKIGDILELVKEHGIGVLNIPSPQGQTGLHVAADHGCYDLIAGLAELGKGQLTLAWDRLDHDGRTCLHLAATHGHLKLCELLLNLSASPLIVSPQGSILHIIASCQDYCPPTKHLISLLVSRGVDINLLHGEEKLAALHTAARRGNTSLILSLLENDAKVDILSGEGHSPLYEAMNAGQKSAVRVLRSHGASMAWFNEENEKLSPEILEVARATEPSKTTPRSPAGSVVRELTAVALPTSASEAGVSEGTDMQRFHSMTVTGNKQEIRKMLKKNPKLLHSLDHEGSSVLHIAAFIQNQELMELFIDKKLDPNIVNAKGYAPLLIAAKAGNLSVCEFLMEHGTDPRVSTEKGFSPLHFLAHLKVDSKEEKQLQRVIKLLTDQGASINQKNNNGDTPLHLACASSTTSVVESLLAHKADVRTYNNLGDTPLLAAVTNDQTAVVSLLLQLDATMAQSITGHVRDNLLMISEDMQNILSEHKVELSAHQNAQTRATRTLQNFQTLIDTYFLQTAATRKRERMERIHKGLLDKESISAPSRIAKAPGACGEMEENWRNYFLSTVDEEDASGALSLTENQIRRLLELCQVPTMAPDLHAVFQLLAGEDAQSVPFDTFCEGFGPALFLFSDPAIALPARVGRTRTLSHERTEESPTRLGHIRSLSDAHLPDVVATATATSPLASPTGKATAPRREKPAPLLPTPTLSIAEMAAIRAERMRMDRESRSMLEPPTATKSTPDLSATVQAQGRPRGVSVSVAQPTPSENVHLPMRRQLTPSKSFLVSRDSMKHAIRGEAKSPPGELQAAPAPGQTTQAYQHFGSLYDRLVKAESVPLLTIDIFEEYFKDSFTSYNLLRTIVPTLMSQKDLEIPGITRDAFCEFFIGQSKGQSMARCLESAIQFRTQLALCLSEAVTSYNNNSSVERFRARAYIQQFSSLVGMVEQNLEDTYQRFLQTKAHTTTVVDSHDTTIAEIRQEILKMHGTLNLLYAPRKTEDCPDPENLPVPPSDTQRRAVIHLIRKLKAKNADSGRAMRTLLDAYAIRCVLVEGCTYSRYKEGAEPHTFELVQCWTPQSLGGFVGEALHRDFVEALEPLKDSEEVVTRMIS